MINLIKGLIIAMEFSSLSFLTLALIAAVFAPAKRFFSFVRNCKTVQILVVAGFVLGLGNATVWIDILF